MERLGNQIGDYVGTGRTGAENIGEERGGDEGVGGQIGVGNGCAS